MPVGDEAGATSGALSSGHHHASGATMSIDHLVFLSQQSLPSKATLYLSILVATHVLTRSQTLDSI